MSTSRRFSIWPNKLIMGLKKWAHGLCHGERELVRGVGSGAPRFCIGDSWPTDSLIMLGWASPIDKGKNHSKGANHASRPNLANWPSLPFWLTMPVPWVLSAEGEDRRNVERSPGRGWTIRIWGVAQGGDNTKRVCGNAQAGDENAQAESSSVLAGNGIQAGDDI